MHDAMQQLLAEMQQGAMHMGRLAAVGAEVSAGFGAAVGTGSGMGLARMGEFHIREDLAAGRLIEILPEATLGDTEDIHAVFPGGRHVPHRVRAFLDFMTPRLRSFLDS